MTGNNPNNTSQDIDIVIKQYCHYWSCLDFAALRGLWDPLQDEPVYLAEEIPSALLDWEAIDSYWRATAEATRVIRVETANLVVRELGPDLVSALYDMRWIGEFAGYRRAIGGDLRVTALLRRRDDGWKFIQYVESPLAPIVYLKRCYERFASEPPPLGLA